MNFNRKNFIKYMVVAVAIFVYGQAVAAEAVWQIVPMVVAYFMYSWEVPIFGPARREVKR